MKVQDIMTDKIAWINSQATITEAAQLMQKHNIGSVPVCENSIVIGMLTDRDIVVRNVAHQKDPSSTKVQDVMTHQLTVVTPDMDADYVSRLMSQEQIRRVPVVENENNKVLVGMVSLGDLATNPQFNVEASETLSDVSKPSKPLNMH